MAKNNGIDHDSDFAHQQVSLISNKQEYDVFRALEVYIY